MKLCKDCKWCADFDLHQANGNFAMCHHPKSDKRNPAEKLVGQPADFAYCETQRMWNWFDINIMRINRCGAKGYWWEPKDA